MVFRSRTAYSYSVSLAIILSCGTSCGHMSPQEALSHALRAHQAGELSTAINHYEAVVLQLGEHNCPAAVLSNLAAVHLALDNSAAAERTWRVAIRVAPSHAESYCNLAIALQRAHAPQHQLREARDFALVAAALRPSYSKAYHALANVEQALGDEAGASRAWYNAEKYAEKQQKAVGTPAVGKLERVLRDMPPRMLSRLREWPRGLVGRAGSVHALRAQRSARTVAGGQVDDEGSAVLLLAAGAREAEGADAAPSGRNQVTVSLTTKAVRRVDLGARLSGFGRD